LYLIKGGRLPYPGEFDVEEEEPKKKKRSKKRRDDDDNFDEFDDS
jgi:hypothetical protein